MRVTVIDIETASNALLNHQKMCTGDAANIKASALRSLGRLGLTEEILKCAVAGMPLPKWMESSETIRNYAETVRQAKRAGELAYELDGLSKIGVSLVELEHDDAELLAVAGANA